MKKELEELPSLLTVSEMADILSLKRSEAYELISSESIPVLRFGLVKWVNRNYLSR